MFLQGLSDSSDDRCVHIHQPVLHLCDVAGLKLFIGILNLSYTLENETQPVIWMTYLICTMRAVRPVHTLREQQVKI